VEDREKASRDSREEDKLHDQRHYGVYDDDDDDERSWQLGVRDLEWLSSRMSWSQHEPWLNMLGSGTHG
jgi:hypothetical protein